MLEERKLYITLGATLLLFGFTLTAAREYFDGIACLIAGAGITLNGLRSLLKKRAIPHSGLRSALLLVLIATASALLLARIFRNL